ncbi:UDP-N-acetylglucosamine 2-epimerase (non-hydrolyzing), partial [Schleiferiaceae bacterium]|nr:UDP-N-acetylglucosamine 2-epimerase (non-hydrolyzing) [Schleiferiaceae bacterium]
MNHITIIAGARPNFMKVAPIIHEIKRRKAEGVDIDYSLVHTGQHYDKKMSGDFFEQLNIPEPDANLNAGGGTQAEQTGAIMIRFEEHLMKNPTDLVLVVGDVTSTMACAITAQKLHIKVAHVEAGIRSNDWTMPEEINRLVTDAITNYFFTTSEVANKTLRASGYGDDQIFFVGNCMIDTLLTNKPRFIQPSIWEEIGLGEKGYFMMTLHRPANVDEGAKLKELMDEIINNTQDMPLVFPVHPRTKKMLNELGIENERLHMVDPMNYLEFNYLVERSFAVVTDSGGITEETTVMGVPCLTLRDNTERPETITVGTNELIGTDPQNIAPAMKKLFAGEWKKGGIPELWDGKTASRIIN